MSPPLAVTVIVWLPIDALLLALTVKVEFPPPGAAMDLGLKVTVSPLAAPDAAKVIAELKLPDTDVVMVEVPELLRATVSDAGEAETAKPAGDDEAVTVSETVAVWVMLPASAVTVTGYVPAGVVASTARVRAEVPEPGAAIIAGLKLAVTPVGSPVADRSTGRLKPCDTAMVTVVVTLAPGAAETEAGETVAVSPVGGAGAPPRALIKLVPFGEPQPVTRS
jgi:hypothetical protein